VTAASKGGDSCVGEGGAPPEAQGLEVLEAGDGVGDQGWNVGLSTPGIGKRDWSAFRHVSMKWRHDWKTSVKSAKPEKD
jgi:hypothetical protein